MKNAILTLRHAFPKNEKDIQAHVDVKLVLNTLKADHIRAGEWLNIIGYVEKSRTMNCEKDGVSIVDIQAILVWSAGSLDVHAYEESFRLHDLAASGA